MNNEFLKRYDIHTKYEYVTPDDRWVYFVNSNLFLSF